MYKFDQTHRKIIINKIILNIPFITGEWIDDVKKDDIKACILNIPFIMIHGWTV